MATKAEVQEYLNARIKELGDSKIWDNTWPNKNWLLQTWMKPDIAAIIVKLCGNLEADWGMGPERIAKNSSNND